jgi:hypothetical protein
LTTNNLVLGNQPGNIPTFRTPYGESNIDLTLTSAQPPVYITNWRVTPGNTSSDHNTIEMEIRLEFLHAHVPQSPETRFVLDTNNIKEEDLAPIVRELVNNLAKIKMETTSQIDQVTQQLYDSLGKILQQIRKKHKILSHRPDWWNEEVDRFRKIYLAKKSIFYRNRILEYAYHLHTEITSAKSKFKEKMEKARTKSWDKFVENGLRKKPMGSRLQAGHGKV